MKNLVHHYIFFPAEVIFAQKCVDMVENMPEEAFYIAVHNMLKQHTFAV